MTASSGGPGGGQPAAGRFPGGAAGPAPRRTGPAPAGPRPSGAAGGTGAGRTGQHPPGGHGRPGRRPGGPGSVSSALSRLLESGASGYRWAAATVGSTSAASLELGSDGVPVMAIGGFSGSDPAPTLAQFEKLVSAHEIHYFVASGSGGPGGAGGGSGSGSQITAWVKAHFTGKTVGGMTVYDLTTPK